MGSLHTLGSLHVLGSLHTLGPCTLWGPAHTAVFACAQVPARPEDPPIPRGYHTCPIPSACPHPTRPDLAPGGDRTPSPGEPGSGIWGHGEHPGGPVPSALTPLRVPAAWPRYRIVGTADSGQYNLEISDAELSDDAVYECQATEAALRSRRAKLTVLSKEPGSPPLSPGPPKPFPDPPSQPRQAQGRGCRCLRRRLPLALPPAARLCHYL